MTANSLGKMPRNGRRRYSGKSSNLFNTSSEKLDKKKLIQNKDTSSPRIMAACFALKEQLWADLVKGRLVVIPRENRSLYREGLYLVREGLAKIEEQTKVTLYLKGDSILTQSKADTHKKRIAYLRLGAKDIKNVGGCNND